MSEKFQIKMGGGGFGRFTNLLVRTMKLQELIHYHVTANAVLKCRSFVLMVLKECHMYDHSRINDRKECLVLGVMEVLGRCQDICIS